MTDNTGQLSLQHCHGCGWQEQNFKQKYLWNSKKTEILQKLTGPTHKKLNIQNEFWSPGDHIKLAIFS